MLLFALLALLGLNHPLAVAQIRKGRPKPGENVSAFEVRVEERMKSIIIQYD